MSWPSSSTWPDVGSSNPAIIRSVVVFPQPDGPSSEKNPPAGISRSMASTAMKDPKRLVSATRLTWPWPGPGWVRGVARLVRMHRVYCRTSQLASA